MKYQIISDGSCDLGQEVADMHQVKVVPFYVSFDDVNYKKEIEEVSVRDFYQKMVDNPNTYPKSSLPSVQDYVDAFEPYVKENIPVICICITLKFSGSYNSACNAKELLLENYPNAKITVIDSTINTVLQGIYVLEAVKMRDAGYGYEETVTRLEEIKSTGRIFFTVGNINYLRKGGRIGKLVTLAVSTLGIRPLIVLKQGEIFPFGITRSRKKSMDKVIEEVKKHFMDNHERVEDYTFSVGYGYSYEEAVMFRDELLTSMNQYGKVDEIPIFQIGATIGVHTGPHPIGLGLVKKYNAK